ncbi:class I SAM-dependent DNA methyltransferase [Amycolatopsis sp. NPDC059027]|uniref:class I SAM-dependent DNA methyltransferase n=1 Tax=Amycolatopsis sp. NPDC059027 TaxID=3346709 RepID=UPI00366B79A7
MEDSYAGLASHYDLVMTSGYYDYDAYARALLTVIGPRADLVEIGVGTGLVCEKILELADTGVRLTGIDHSASMLAVARRRLGTRVTLEHQDVLRLTLPRAYDVAYSIGGVWACTRAGDDVRLASLLPTDSENLRALENVRDCLKPEGMVVLSVQRPHVDHQQRLRNGFVYSQEVREEGNGMVIKDYRVTDGEVVVARQRSRIRIFERHEAEDLLARAGFRPVPENGDGLFHMFTVR